MCLPLSAWSDLLLVSMPTWANRRKQQRAHPKALCKPSSSAPAPPAPRKAQKAKAKGGVKCKGKASAPPPNAPRKRPGSKRFWSQRDSPAEKPKDRNGTKKGGHYANPDEDDKLEDMFKQVLLRDRRQEAEGRRLDAIEAQVDKRQEAEGRRLDAIEAQVKNLTVLLTAALPALKDSAPNP